MDRQILPVCDLKDRVTRHKKTNDNKGITMDFSTINIVKMMKTKMGYSSERQDILSKNISNIDTPGYKPKDLKKLDFDKMASFEAHRLTLRSTQPNHMAPRQKATDFRSETSRKVYETTPTKNGVVLEEQQMKVAANQIDFQTTSNLYKKMSDMFRTAIGKQ